MKAKVLIIVSNANSIGKNNRRTGTFLPEVAHPYAEFQKADFDVDFASLTGESPFLDALNLADDPDNLKFLTGKGWEDMHKAAKLSEVDVKNYDAVFIPGGLAPMVDMPENDELKKVIADVYERDGIVAAVCHGPVSFLNVKLGDGTYLVNGRNITSFSTEEEENYAKDDVPFDLQTALTEQGAIFHAAEAWSENSISDGNLITGQNPASAKGVGEKIVALLESRKA